MIKKIESIARLAGDVIMGHFLKHGTVEHKIDGSPVTKADSEAESLIIKELTVNWPNIPTIGEESFNHVNNIGNILKKPYWLIDPLDGTKEFIDDSPEFTVNIALIDGGIPKLGVVYAPAKDLLYAGGADVFAYCIENGISRDLHVSGTGKPVVVMSRRHPSKGVEEQFLSKLRNFTSIDLQLVGSSLKFCMVAEGTASIYFRCGTTMYWDTAAGHAVVKAAGGIVRQWDYDSELEYNSETLKNPGFIIMSPNWATLINDLCTGI
jgi:3'(2'), 5'-bisphosphate nucleotidase